MPNQELHQLAELIGFNLAQLDTLSADDLAALNDDLAAAQEHVDNEMKRRERPAPEPPPVPPPVGVREVTRSEKRDRQAKNRRSRYPQSRRVARGER